MTATIAGAPHATADTALRTRSAATSTRTPDNRTRTAARRQSCTAQLNARLEIVGADPAFCRLFGRTTAETCGRSLYDLLHPSAPVVLGHHFARLSLRRCDRFTERIVGATGGGEVFSGELTAIAVHGASGDLTGVVVLLRPDADGAVAVDSTGEPVTGHPARRLLSKVDAAVLEGVADGSSTVQLAARLHLSRQGVEYHVGSMLRKFRVPNRAALVARAHALGMLSADQWPPRVPPEFIK